MPSEKDTSARLVEGWSLADQVEELRGKFQLKKKDSESYRNSSNQEIRRQEKVISELRQSNRRRRVELAQDENGDERVIKTVFRNERTERLSLQRFTATQAIDEMDQKVCEAATRRADLVYERENRQRRLAELKQEHARMQQLETPSAEQKQDYQRVTTLENSLDKALIKYDTACIISKKYKDILDNLKEESLTLPAKMDAMEQALLHQRSELRELRAMAKDALAAKDTAKRELNQVEQSSYEAKRQRDKELTTTRKEVERRRAEGERVDRRQLRATLITDQADVRAQQEAQQQREAQRRMLSFADAFKRITEATHVNCIEDVLGRVMMHTETKQQLTTRVSALESQRGRLRDELNKLAATYHDMKYTGETKLSKGQRLLEEMQENFESETKRLVRLKDQSLRNGDTLVEVKMGISTLLDILTDVKLRPPHHNYARGDVFEQLHQCSLRLDRLAAELPTGGATDTPVNQALYQQFLEGHTAPDNVRIKLQPSDSQLSEFDYDAQENEVLGREDIKKLGQKMIDSKQRSKRRKAKKK